MGYLLFSSHGLRTLVLHVIVPNVIHLNAVVPLCYLILNIFGQYFFLST